MHFSDHIYTIVTVNDDEAGQPIDSVNRAAGGGCFAASLALANSCKFILTNLVLYCPEVLY